MSKSIEQINNVLIVGAGTLGLRIALRCALDGYQVKMFDINPAQLETAQQTQDWLSKDLLAKSKIDQASVDRARANLQPTSDINVAVTDIDLVSESVIEDIDIKRDFYRDFAPRLAPGTIVTTNTSYLLPSMMLQDIVEPENFCGFHFHDVFNQTVVDVMPHADTDPAVADLLMEFGRRIQQIPVYIKKENPGYIFNTMLMSLLAQAGALYMDEVGSIEDIDRSFMGNFNTPIGPFGMLDQIGLDTAWHVTAAQPDARAQEFAKVLKSMLDAGDLGFKSGKGFYSYPNPAFTEPGFLTGTK